MRVQVRGGEEARRRTWRRASRSFEEYIFCSDSVLQRIVEGAVDADAVAVAGFLLFLFRSIDDGALRSLSMDGAASMLIY